MMQLITVTIHLLDSQGRGALRKKMTESSTQQYSLGQGVFIISITAFHFT